MSAEALEQTPAQVALRWNVQQGIAVVPNSLCPEHILENVNLNTFNMAPFRMAVLTEMSTIRSLPFHHHRPADAIAAAAAAVSSSGSPSAPLFSYGEVKGKGLVYMDDGTIIEAGSEYEYMELTIEVFERLELGDMAELLVEPIEIDGVFPGVDVEPIED